MSSTERIEHWFGRLFSGRESRPGEQQLILRSFGILIDGETEGDGLLGDLRRALAGAGVLPISWSQWQTRLTPWRMSGCFVNFYVRGEAKALTAWWGVAKGTSGAVAVVMPNDAFGRAVVNVLATTCELIRPFSQVPLPLSQQCVLAPAVLWNTLRLAPMLTGFGALEPRWCEWPSALDPPTLTTLLQRITSMST